MNSIKPVVLNLRQINRNDNTFDIFDRPRGKREHSTFLLPHPILVQRQESQYRLIYGFEILDYADEEEIELAAYRLPETINPLNILKLILQLKTSSRILSPPEIGRFLQLAKKLHLNPTEIQTKLLPLMHLSGDDRLINQYRSLVSVPEPLYGYLLSRNAPLKTWLRFAGLSEEEYQCYARLVTCLRPSLSVLEEIENNMREIQSRDKISLKDILRDLDWEQYLVAESETKVALSRLRQAIYAKRFPQTSGHLQKIRRRIKDLSLPANAALNFDETCERRELELTWRLKTPKDLQRLREFVDSQTLKKIQRLLDEL
jgi:hypothetical protein